MLQLNGRGGTRSGHNGVPFKYANPLNNATSSWSSPVTQMRQVESVRVRATSSASAVSRPERTVLNQVTSAWQPTASTPCELQASAKADRKRVNSAPPCRIPTAFRWRGSTVISVRANPVRTSTIRIPFSRAKRSCSKYAATRSPWFRSDGSTLSPPTLYYERASGFGQVRRPVLLPGLGLVLEQEPAPDEAELLPHLIDQVPLVGKM